MGVVRSFSPHTKWTDDEVAILRRHYASAPLNRLDEMLPGRRRRMIACKANGLGLVRLKAPKQSDEERLAKKREHMARKRAIDPEPERQRQRIWLAANRERVNEQRRGETMRRLFWGRALRLRGVSGWDLWKLWKAQRGRCALTGVKLDRTAEIDHRLPKKRGGTDDVSNLQWVTHTANFAKRDLTDAEFLELCQNVARWVGRRIEMVEQIAADLDKEAAA